MSDGSTKKKNVNVKVFAKIVRESSTIDEIEAATGLKRNTISTKLNSLRKLVGKENVKSFKTAGKPRTSKEEILAILQAEG